MFGIEQLGQVGRKRAVLAAVIVGALLAVFWIGRMGADASADPRKAAVTRGVFEDVIRRRGTILPLAKEKVMIRVRGTILNIAADGSRVTQGQVVVQLDPKPHEEALANQEANLARIRADREKARQNEMKELRKAQDDVETHKLRVDLETLRLKDLELGPSTSAELDAQVNLQNARNLFKARQEEFEILKGLAADGFVSKVEVRQKELDLREQELNVDKADLAYRKLHTLDPIQIGEQKLKVRDEEKNLISSQERAALVAKNNQQAQDRHDARMRREEQRLKDLQENVQKTSIAAPVPGVALQQSFWGMQPGPGREVREGHEVMTISDLRKMKVALTVDEGRIARVTKGMKALVRPTGSDEKVFAGTVTYVAETCRDEFEDYREETKNLVGKAQRQVFDVEVEVAEESALLRPGLRVDVEIVVQRAENALLVPRAALAREKDGQAYVRLAGPLGPERKNVSVKGENEIVAAVEGLDEGQRVWMVEP
ncbi:MAG: HlyD family efflux transporter periplasmic adaptor subunit [Planctomycetota bacterium]|nr:HlyD family efflux transporter periplasmic adaptor subunit [Planctomycetota bacterium]